MGECVGEREDIVRRVRGECVGEWEEFCRASTLGSGSVRAEPSEEGITSMGSRFCS